MARPTTPKTYYRDKNTRYIYRISYRTKIRFADAGFPTPEPVEMLTLKFEGRHPEDENTIFVSLSDLLENFEVYEPLKVAKADGQTV